MASESKYNCGLVVPSSCVPYTGVVLTFLTEEEALPCDKNLNDVISRFNTHVKKLVDGNDLTGLDKDCFNFDPATVTPAELHQLEITKICLLSGQQDSLQTQFNTLNIGAEVITIDLDTLAPDAAPCVVGTNQYTLISLLTLYKNEIITLKQQIADLL